MKRPRIDRATVWVGTLSLMALFPVYYVPAPVLFGLEITAVKYWPFLVIVCQLLATLMVKRSRCLLSVAVAGSPMVVGTFLVAVVSLWNVDSVVGAMPKILYFGVTGQLVFLLTQALSYRQIQYVSDGMVAVGVAVSAYAVIEMSVGYSPVFQHAYGHSNPYYSGVGRASSTVGNPIAVGALLSAILPLSLARCLASSFSLRNTVCALTIAVGIWLTYARSAWIAALAGLLVIAWGHRQQLCRRLILVPFALTLSLLIAPTAELLYPGSEERTESAIVRLLHFRESERGRLMRYVTTWNMLSEFPFLGVGFGQYTSVYDDYIADGTPPSPVRTSDNNYLMIAGETGLFGLGAYVGFALFLLTRLSQSFRLARPDDWFELAILSSVVAMHLNMIFWDPLNHPLMRTVFWLLLGLGMRRAAHNRSLSNPSPSPPCVRIVVA